MLADHMTLAQFLIEERRRHPATGGDLDSLILDVALACKAVANRVALGTLRGTPGRDAPGRDAPGRDAPGRDAPGRDAPGRIDRTNVHGEVQHTLEVIANDYFLRATERSGCLAVLASEELDEPHVPPAEIPRGNYLLVVDPLDGSSNIDLNASVGSIFSILRAPEPGVDATTEDFLQPGTAQVCAGYALYGPATMLVLTLGRGVHSFTLDPALGEFVLTQEPIRVPRPASEAAINASNRPFWEPAVRRYVDGCRTGRSGSRHQDFNMLSVASLVAETHRILTRGGVFLCPRDTKDPAKPGRLRLLFEANPVALLIEQAGGAASTGRERVLDVIPSGLHEHCPLIFGAEDAVALIDRYHQQHNDRPYDSPLYGDRGLFRVGTG